MLLNSQADDLLLEDQASNRYSHRRVNDSSKTKKMDIDIDEVLSEVNGAKTNLNLESNPNASP